MLMVRELAYHLALKMLPVTHQDSGEFIFTAQCTLVHLRGLGIACRLSVCPSVRLSVRPSVTLVICDHIG